LALKSAGSIDPMNDHAALTRRAERFQREHDIERQKNMRGAMYGGHTSLKANSQHAHLFNERISSRSSSPSIFGGNPDDPEADPVRFACPQILRCRGTAIYLV
jgi:SAC3 family protein LENG8/THP3